MRTFPPRENVQGATYYYYPGRWIQFQAALTVHNFHSQGSIPCRSVYYGVKANTYSTYLLHPTRSPFIHLNAHIFIHRGCSRRNILLLPQSLDKFQDHTYRGTISHSQGAFLTKLSIMAFQANTYSNISFAYRVPIYTPGWRAAMWIKCLAEDNSARHRQESNLQSVDPESRVQSNIPQIQLQFN